MSKWVHCTYNSGFLKGLLQKSAVKKWAEVFPRKSALNPQVQDQKNHSPQNNLESPEINWKSQLDSIPPHYRNAEFSFAVWAVSYS